MIVRDVNILREAIRSIIKESLGRNNCTPRDSTMPDIWKGHDVKIWRDPDSEKWHLTIAKQSKIIDQKDFPDREEGLLWARNKIDTLQKK